MIGFNYLGKLGQLGNQMFQYASLKGIAKHRGFDYMVPVYSDTFVDSLGNKLRTELFNPFNLKVNIGSEEMVTINQLVDTAAKVAGKKISKNHIDGPLGVRGRNSNNDLIREKLGWDYSQTLEEGIRKTYKWIQHQIKNQ